MRPEPESSELASQNEKLKFWGNRVRGEERCSKWNIKII
jgi:hypothetical protein